MAARFLSQKDLTSLFEALSVAGYRVLGPRERDGAIVFDEMHLGDELPRGLRDSQAPGSYRVEQEGERYFDWANGPQALKPLCFAPREVLWRAGRNPDGTLHFLENTPQPDPTAVIGVRACDLAALALQDRHFLAPGRVDAHYRARRESLLLIAVDCNRPAATCFCASTGDGPQVEDDHDVFLHELDDGFVIRAGSARGKSIVEQLPLTTAGDEQLARVEQDRRAAVEQQSRALPGQDLSATLFENLEHPRWEEVGGRCLSCGNCTAVCPTCFCNDLLQNPELAGDENAAVRQWDSCFTAGHSYFAGKVLREDTRKRYRQWMTHKLAGWHEQFGRSGCTGCGRCITWCPVGIDLTEEAAAICGSGT